MVKISFIASGIILGLATISSASASIISRSFLDQALTDYATNTALDLKANQSDLTALSNKIGTLPSGNFPILPGHELLSKTDLPSTYPTSLAELISYIFGFSENGRPGLLAEIIGTLRIDTNGDGSPDRPVGLIPNFVLARDANDLANANAAKIGTLPSGEIIPSKGLAFLLPDTDYTYPTSIGDFMEQMYDGYWGISVLAEAVYYGNEFMGQTDTTRQVKGLRQITDEIGTLPSGNFPIFPGYDPLFPEFNQPLTYPTSLAELITAIYGNSETGEPGLLAGIIAGFPIDTNGDGQFDSSVGTLSNFNFAKEANDLANANATKIGTLPSGSLLGNSPAMDALFKFTQGTDTPVFPNSLSDLINQLYGSEGGRASAISALLHGFRLDGFSDIYSVGVLPAMELGLSATQTAKTALATAQANTAKIGTVPDGKNLAGMISETDAKIGSWNAGNIAHGTSNPLFTVWAKFLPQFTNLYQELYLSRPISLADLISKLYGRSSDEDFGILGNIGALLDVFDEIITSQRAKIGTVPDGKNLAGMISETDAKIGDLPTEYATVGAALTAMDAKIDAQELPSSSDDGQYVLSAKKVGDTITYTWVKMDLTNEEQAQ